MKVFKKFLVFILIILVFAAGYFFIRPFFATQNDTKNSPNQTNQSNQSFSFIVAGDSHNNLERYKQIIEGANSSGAAMLIDLGDITRVGEESEYRNFKNNLSSLKIPYHIVLGNHDIVGNGYNYFQKYFGETFESFDLQDSHFVILDNVSDPNVFSDEQLSWLENDLAANKKTLKFVFTHTPVQCPFVPKSELGFTGAKADEQIQKFIEILKKHGVSQIFSGHIHNYLSYSIDGIPIIVTGGAGGPLYKIPIFGKNYYHYLKIDVSGRNFSSKVVELK